MQHTRPLSPAGPSNAGLVLVVLAMVAAGYLGFYTGQRHPPAQPARPAPVALPPPPPGHVRVLLLISVLYPPIPADPHDLDRPAYLSAGTGGGAPRPREVLGTPYLPHPPWPTLDEYNQFVEQVRSRLRTAGLDAVTEPSAVTGPVPTVYISASTFRAGTGLFLTASASMYRPPVHAGDPTPPRIEGEYIGARVGGYDWRWTTRAAMRALDYMILNYRPPRSPAVAPGWEPPPPNPPHRAKHYRLPPGYSAP